MEYLKIYIFTLTLEDTNKNYWENHIFHIKLVSAHLARAKTKAFKSYKKVDAIGTTSRHQNQKMIKITPTKQHKIMKNQNFWLCKIL